MGKGFIRNLALALWFCSSSHSLVPAGCGLLCAAEGLAAVVLALCLVLMLGFCRANADLGLPAFPSQLQCPEDK